MKINDSTFVIGIALTLLLASCKQGGSQSSDADTETSTPAAPLVSIPAETMQDLWNNCDALDIIFYASNFSMSQGEQSAIRNTLGFILPSTSTPQPNCKPVGSIAFLVKGEIRQVADIYVSEGCHYFLWMNDIEPSYSNTMSPQGVAFFEGVMNQAKQVQ